MLRYFDPVATHIMTLFRNPHLPEKELNKSLKTLQLIQNAAAHVLTGELGKEITFLPY